jgi:hypothetical protein
MQTTDKGAKMESKTFSKNDSGFICANCGRKVEPLKYSSRNHCPYCLWSLHLDENPGDRASSCGGRMRPIGARPDPKKGYVITHKCTVCGAVRNCKAALSGDQPDDINEIIRLTACHED